MRLSKTKAINKVLSLYDGLTKEQLQTIFDAGDEWILQINFDENIYITQVNYDKPSYQTYIDLKANTHKTYLYEVTLGDIKSTLTRKGKKLLEMSDYQFERLLQDNGWSWDDAGSIVDKDGNLISNRMLEATV